MFEAALEAGAENVESDDEIHEITCAPDDFSTVRDALVEQYGDPGVGKLDWKATTTVPATVELAQKIANLLDTLDDSDDVQSVAANLDVPDDIAEQLASA